ncbi:MAG: amidohydrolase family protein, partial [Deltaproteobacteria bacterium]|nr:amidohydrolase family protein [Deltaproteobacteria bacterium]
MRALVSALVIASACGSTDSSVQPRPPSSPDQADLLIVGAPGALSTLDDGRQVQAVAINSGKLVEVGSCEQLKSRIGVTTQVLRLAPEHRGYPGLADAHAHLYGLGKALESVDLRASSSAKEVAQRIAKAAAELPTGTWVTGRGWDQNLWTPQKFPTAEQLPDMDRPIAVRRVDGHALWANRKAMAIAGITARTPDPKGGTIVRDSKGKATGIFIDTAIDLVESKIPKPN